jgi:hypothetical protein
MSIKVSDLPLQTAVDLESGSLVYVVDPTTPITSYKTTLGAVKTFVTTPATTSVLGAVIVGTGIAVDVNGVISTTPLVPATTSALGGVIVGSGFDVAVDGTLTYSKKMHAFSKDATGNLIYSTTTDSSISFQDSTGEDIYSQVDIGTSDYVYSMDANGNLIVTFS